MGVGARGGVGAGKKRGTDAIRRHMVGLVGVVRWADGADGRMGSLASRAVCFYAWGEGYHTGSN